jgi:hypothetical protein
MFRISDGTKTENQKEEQLNEEVEVLITKSDLSDRQNVILDYIRQIDEIKLEHEYQLRLKDMNYGDKLKEATEMFSNMIEKEKIVTTDLRMTKDQDEIDFEASIQGMKAENFKVFHVHLYVVANTNELECRSQT